MEEVLIILTLVVVSVVGWRLLSNGEDWCEWQCPNSGTCSTCDGWPGNERS